VGVGGGNTSGSSVTTARRLMGVMTFRGCAYTFQSLRDVLS
jgi:hypothetical protein